jgi:hypothetical protein
MGLPTLGVLVFGGILWAFWRAGELRFIQAACAGLVGFFLASSKLAPDITRGVTALFEWISTWHI